jgi:hypothetical protein
LTQCYAKLLIRGRRELGAALSRLPREIDGSNVRG